MSYLPGDSWRQDTNLNASALTRENTWQFPSCSRCLGVLLAGSLCLSTRQCLASTELTAGETPKVKSGLSPSHSCIVLESASLWSKSPVPSVQH